LHNIKQCDIVITVDKGGRGMIQKYIIGKEDLPKLIKGEELPLSQGSKARAFKIEIIENLTNGDIIMAMFDTATIYGIDKENDWIVICIDDIFYQKFRYSWWNEPYKEDRREV
jgi:hypothetical protein